MNEIMYELHIEEEVKNSLQVKHACRLSIFKYQNRKTINRQTKTFLFACMILDCRSGCLDVSYKHQSFSKLLSPDHTSLAPILLI